MTQSRTAHGGHTVVFNPGTSQNSQNFRTGLGFNPPHFNGESRDQANTFWQKFLRYTKAHNIQGNERSTIFGLLVSDTAELWYNALPEQTRNNFEQLEQAFKAQYVNAPAQDFKRKIDMLKCKQLVNESVDSYFTKTLSQFDGQSLPLDLRLALLIDGLQPSLRAVVLQHGPYDAVSSLLDRCRRVESSLTTADPSGTTHSFVTSAVAAAKERLADAVKDLKEEMRHIKRKISDIASKVQKSTLPRERKKVYYATPRKACYNCGSFKHIARYCTVYRTGLRKASQNSHRSSNELCDNSATPSKLQSLHQGN